VIVSCERGEDPYVETNPRLIIEVLSSSTERIDREEKRLAYQSIDTLHEYVLVSQSTPDVQVYRRAGSDWTLKDYGEGDRLELTSIELTVDVEQIYEDVQD
jgi:Uma2 family endonuclease